MKPGGPRRKGNTFERWVAATLNVALGLTGDAAARRGLSQTRGGGAEVGDVTLPGWALHFECKHSKADTPRTAIRQATADLAARGDTETTPVAVVRKHGGREVMVGLYTVDALALLAAAVPPNEAPVSLRAITAVTRANQASLDPRTRARVGRLSLDTPEEHPLTLFLWPDFLALLARCAP